MNRFDYIRPATIAEAVQAARDPGAAFLAGGTWLFSEPQTDLTRLIDITRLAWPPLIADDNGLHIAATCTIATLAAFEPPPSWTAGPLIVQCCRALLGSFKIWNMATVGGNICMALPAGPMTSLATALRATCVIWTAAGMEAAPTNAIVGLGIVRVWSGSLTVAEFLTI